MASSRTRVRIPLRTFLLKGMLARASYYKHVSLGPQDLGRSLGRHVRPYSIYGDPSTDIRPKDPAVPTGGECYKAYPRLCNRSIVYPGSSVGSTITRVYDISQKRRGCLDFSAVKSKHNKVIMRQGLITCSRPICDALVMFAV